MDLYRLIKKSTFPKSVELLLELMTSEVSIKKLRPGSIEGLVENCLLRPCQQSALQRFQVTTMLLKFYSNKQNYKTLNETFMSIFTRSSSLELLHNLVSSAILLRNNHLLDSAAQWMNMTGLTSGVVVALVRKLLEDNSLHSTTTQSFLTSSSCPSTNLVNTPPSTLQISHSFITNCFVVITILYPGVFKSDRQKDLCVSVSTVQLICDWLQLHPSIYHSYKTNYTNINNNNNNKNNNNTNNSNNNNALVVLLGWIVQATIQSDPACETPSQHWHKLHYLVLQSLSTDTSSLPATTSTHVTSFIHLQQLLLIFQAVTSTINKLTDGSDIPPHLEVLLEQICQFVQVAMSSNALVLTKTELRQLFEECPNTRLVQIIKKKHNY